MGTTGRLQENASGVSGVVGAQAVTERYLVRGDDWVEVLAQRGDALEDGTTFPAVNQAYPTQTSLKAADWRPSDRFLSGGEVYWKVDVIYNLVGADFNFTPVNPADPAYNQHKLQSAGRQRITVPILYPREQRTPKNDGSGGVATTLLWEQGGFDIVMASGEYEVTCNLPNPGTAAINAGAGVIHNSKLNHIHQFGGGGDWLFTNFSLDDTISVGSLQAVYGWTAAHEFTSSIMNAIATKIGGVASTAAGAIDITKAQVPPARKWWEAWTVKWETVSPGGGMPDVLAPRFVTVRPFTIDATGHTSMPFGSPF